MEATHKLKHEDRDVVSVVSDTGELDEIEDIIEDTPIPYLYDISSYGADFPVDSLVKRLNNGDIFVPTFGQYRSEDGQILGFQRNYVWSKQKADRFIESLLLGLPVPGIFLVRDRDGRLLVLDGQQRLITLQRFYGEDGRMSNYRLRNVHPDFAGRSYDELDPEITRRLDDSLIHATIVKQDKSTDDQSSIYDIFERLNTGGVNLQPQEIRGALYHGDFAHLLFELNKNSNWRALYGRESVRLKDLEMILRFFAFFYSGDEYSKPMKSFLNKYMGENRNLECQSRDELEGLFCKTVSFLQDCLGNKAFRPRGSLNAAVIDSVMTGIAKRIQRRPIHNCQDVESQLLGLFENDEYFAAVETGTSEEGKVRTRQRLAAEAFADIQ